MTISTFRTQLPSHVIRRAAFDRCAPPGAHFPGWIEVQWNTFARRHGYRTRNGTAQAHFDKHLEAMKCP